MYASREEATSVPGSVARMDELTQVKDIAGFREEFDGEELNVSTGSLGDGAKGVLRLHVAYDDENSPLSGTRDNYKVEIQVDGLKVYGLNELGGPRLTGFAGDSLYGLRRMVEPALAFAVDAARDQSPLSARDNAEVLARARDMAAEYQHAIDIEHELGLDLPRLDPELTRFPTLDRSAFEDR